MRADNTIITILGRKGTGKTMLLLEVLDDYPRVIVLDSTGEYDEESGFVVCDDLHRALDALVESESEPRYRLSYRPEDDTQALRFLQAAYEAEGFTLVIDEANIYMSANSIPPILANYVRRGRHREINQIYAAQRASSIHREVTSQSDVIVAFHQHEKRDVEYLRAEGFGDRADWLPHLETHQAIVYAVEERKIPLAALSRRVSRNPLTGQKDLFQDTAQADSSRLDDPSDEDTAASSQS